MRRTLAGALAGAVLVSSPIPAVAHSLLLEARPAANSAIAAPTRVTLRFNNRIEKRLSRVTIVEGERMRHDLAVIASEGATDTLTALAPPLAPGAYYVEWQVLSTDGHVVTGRYPFRVVP
jgi:methionine-rich copper-binding protein CopC